jgi:hypothetical protein
MQGEIDTTHPAKAVHILGVNAVGQDRDNALICTGRALPWLQDTPQQNVWGAWAVVWRDVYILDARGRLLYIYNLTEHPLELPHNYAELESLLLSAARADP